METSPLDLSWRLLQRMADAVVAVRPGRKFPRDMKKVRVPGFQMQYRRNTVRLKLMTLGIVRQVFVTWCAHVPVLESRRLFDYRAAFPTGHGLRPVPILRLGPNDEGRLGKAQRAQHLG